MNNEYTLSKILKKLDANLQITHPERFPQGVPIVNYPTFRNVMMIDETMKPIITYERTAKEKFKLLQDLGFISKTNVVNVDAVKHQIGLE